MTVAELQPAITANAAKVAQNISQVTAVEQARAVAEVQAAVVVAQQVPRDIDRALADMADSCGRLALANRAFYSVPKRGNGPSVHLARELARIWGNIDYGVKELRRDDEAGESEVLAFAWDQQTNVRSVRSFIVPHARMKEGKRQPLTDLGDIYLSNQNVGARAVRECIFTVLPTWFTEEAQDRCRRTLEDGEGVPMAERVTNAVGRFEAIGVSLARLESKIGRKRGQWTGADLGDLAVAYSSITRDGVADDALFPTEPVTAEEIAASRAGSQRASQTPPSAVPPVQPAEEPTSDADETGPSAPSASEASGDDRDVPATKAQVTKLNILLQENGVTDRDAKLAYLGQQVGRELASSKDLTKAEANSLIDAIEAERTEAADE